MMGLFKYNVVMLEDKIKDEIQSSVSVCFGKHVKIAEIAIEKTADKKFGDFASNISFQLAKELKKSPKEIAEKLAGDLNGSGPFEKAEAVNGFLNFTLSKQRYAEILEEIIKKSSKFGDNSLFQNEKIQVEFISANPTGPLTLGNGRGGFGGDALGNVLEKCGAKVEREYYINDGGNQVTTLGKSILYLHEPNSAEEDLYRGEYVSEWAESHEDMLGKYQNNPFGLGALAAKDILERHIKPSVARIGIEYNNWFSENDMIEAGEVERAIDLLNKNGLTEEKDGALWFLSTKFSDDKDRVLVKSDGEKTYFANDIAYHWDKFYKRKFDKVINIWGADHHGYIGRLLAAAEAMDRGGRLEIVITQLVRLIKDGQEYKMSKRKGTFVTMDDLLELIGGADAADVARFFFLSRAFNTHMDFDLSLAKDNTEKNPVFYVKYASARMHGILANNKVKMANNKKDPALDLLTDDTEIELIDKLSELPGLVEFIATAGNYPVHLLTSYAIEVAKKFHHFYDKCRVIDEENPELTTARLELVRGAQIILRIVGEDLIGISMPDKM